MSRKWEFYELIDPSTGRMISYLESDDPKAASQAGRSLMKARKKTIRVRRRSDGKTIATWYF